VNALKSYFSPSLAMPLAILIVIFLLVLPIPAMMLDVFFVLNIALSLAVLMTAMNVNKPLDFSSFPTVLLFATLLRLALNVASTRVVLIAGHEGGDAAGKVIEAFGEFLVGGDFVVGLFVFMILMIINLMVVTKGAGRVSEVSARFTLDALPGKQMAIDADLAAGLVTAAEAKTRRREIATEADFYGSMDGASKFVKGDAIAALLILAVNVIAGLVLGMVTHGLTANQAGQLYITLAVGDALVASVPSLLLSIAAAMIVTRVSDTRDLSGQIGGQFADHRTWLPVGVILLLLGLIPAMPQSIFLPFAAVSFFLWHKLRRNAAERAIADAAAEAEPAPDPSVITIEDVSENALVSVELGYGLVHLADERKGAPLVARLTGLRRQLSETFGFIVPQIRIRDSLECQPGEYRVRLGGTRLGGAMVRPDRLLAIDAGDVSPHAFIDGDDTIDPSFGCPAKWIEARQREMAVAEGYLVVEPENVIATHINQLLMARAHLLLGPDELRELLDNVKVRNAALVEAITPQPMSLGALTRLLRSLLDDGITLAHPLPVLNALAQSVQVTTEHDTLVDMMRTQLGGQLIGQICGPNDKLPVVTLAAELEDMVVGGLVDPSTGQPVIDPDLARTLGAQLADVLAQRPPGSPPAALIVQPRARRPLAALLKLRAPQCAVLSISELPPEQPIDVIAVIGGDVQQPAQPALEHNGQEAIAA
tara:strand:+ start:37600 stop:39720 length:2121 start_codon:yes stop_codon:yes gene_type:complete